MTAILSTVGFALSVFWLGVLAGRWAVRRRIECGSVFPQLGPAGVRGWLKGQWYRVRKPVVDYRMVNSGQPVHTGMMYGGLPSPGESVPTEWGPPASAGDKSGPHWINDPEAVVKELMAMPDWSKLTDEELEAELANRPCVLGTGLLAEKGRRQWLKENGR